MNKIDASIEYEEGGMKIKEMLYPHNREEEEENQIARENSKLVFKPRYLSIPRELWKLNKYEMLLMSFILFYADSSSDRFYFTNEQLAEMFQTTTRTITTSMKELNKKGYIKLHYRRKANGGQIRFIILKEVARKYFQLQLENISSSKRKKLLGKDNKIKDNKIKDRYNIKNVDNLTEVAEHTREVLDKQKKETIKMLKG